MEDVSLAALLLRLVVSMGVVVTLMLLSARVLRRATSKGGLSGRGKVRRTPINLEAIQPLTKSAHIAVVRAAGRELVVGVTEHQVTLLHSSIEPRDSAQDLDVDVDVDLSTTTTQAIESPLSALDAHTGVDTRIVSATAETQMPAGDAGEDHGSVGQSAWTDALELLREKTVRR